VSHAVPALLVVAALVAAACTGVSGPPPERADGAPLVIAHRGASGERPEHTLEAYRLAIAQGADFIEPDLVLTKDGVFVARHENEISGTTDVAARPEFAARKTTRVIDGETVSGWFTEDFTLAELKTLRAKERLPQLRPANARFDGREPIPTFEEVAALARAESARTGRAIGVYPELKHPAHFAAAGLPMEVRFAELLKRLGLNGADAPIFVQCFEVGPLKTLNGLVEAPLVQLVSASGGPADLPGRTYAEMLTPQGLREVAAYADGIGPEKTLILPRDAEGRSLAPTTLVADAHAAGLKVHPWTFRAENYFLPLELRRGLTLRPDYMRLHGDLEGELKQFYALGVDGVFSDFPGRAVAARDQRRAR